MEDVQTVEIKLDTTLKVQTVVWFEHGQIYVQLEGNGKHLAECQLPLREIIDSAILKLEKTGDSGEICNLHEELYQAQIEARERWKALAPLDT